MTVRKLVLLVSSSFLLSFLSQCTTLLLRDYQKSTNIYGFYYYFYEVFKDTSGKPGTTIVESPNDWFDSNKIFHYCANNSLPSLETNLDKDYSYEIQRRKKDETCKKLYNSTKSKVTIAANGSLLLFDLGTRVDLTPGYDEHSPISALDLVIYKGPLLRKSIQNIKAAWISKGSICLEDSSKKIVSLDCSNMEGNGDFERRVCIQTSADCSNKTYPLYLSSIPRFAPTYFLKERCYGGGYGCNSVSIAAWFPEHVSNQSQIVEIEIGKFSEQMIISKTIPYVMSYGLYPVTIVLDVITFPFQIAAIFLFLKDFNPTGFVPPGRK
ncbi:hypothetical protein [Leptospira kirschneri]|uniref:hypothetical protein n=1 Tax=Leptospira kirschneri TaxID=29507 RepID=UPI00046C73D5|nr:hypothetical protein [Leptospira kirschneri]UML82155.1 hypothetical protein FH602_05575 [Leptospira kirschneri]